MSPLVSIGSPKSIFKKIGSAKEFNREVVKNLLHRSVSPNINYCPNNKQSSANFGRL